MFSSGRSVVSSAKRKTKTSTHTNTNALSIHTYYGTPTTCSLGTKLAPGTRRERPPGGCPGDAPRPSLPRNHSAKDHMQPAKTGREGVRGGIPRGPSPCKEPGLGRKGRPRRGGRGRGGYCCPDVLLLSTIRSRSSQVKSHEEYEKSTRTKKKSCGARGELFSRHINEDLKGAPIPLFSVLYTQGVQ